MGYDRGIRYLEARISRSGRMIDILYLWHKRDRSIIDQHIDLNLEGV